MNGAPASLTAALLSRRGASAGFGFLGANRLDLDQPIVIPAAPTLLRADAERRNLPHSDTVARTRLPAVASREVVPRERPLRQTVPLDRERHARLRLAAVKLQSSARQLMVDALDHYLATVVPARVSAECHCLQPLTASSGPLAHPPMPEPDP